MNEQSLHPVRDGDTYGCPWGYRDAAGAWAIPPRFQDGSPFSEGLARVTVDNRSGYIDETGTLIVKPHFNWGEPFHEGLAAVIVGSERNARYGYIDRTGAMVIAPRFTRAESFQNGKAAVRVPLPETWLKAGEYKTTIDATGRILDPGIASRVAAYRPLPLLASLHRFNRHLFGSHHGGCMMTLLVTVIIPLPLMTSLPSLLTVLSPALLLFSLVTLGFPFVYSFMLWGETGYASPKLIIRPTWLDLLMVGCVAFDLLFFPFLLCLKLAGVLGTEVQ